MHFDFKDWEKAFATFYRLHCGYPIMNDKNEQIGFYKGDTNYCLIISTNWTTSGYWVEKYANEQITSTDIVYKTLDEVKYLEKKLRQAIEDSRFEDGRYPLSLGKLIT